MVDNGIEKEFNVQYSPSFLINEIISKAVIWSDVRTSALVADPRPGMITLCCVHLLTLFFSLSSLLSRVQTIDQTQIQDGNSEEIPKTTPTDRRIEWTADRHDMRYGASPFPILKVFLSVCDAKPNCSSQRQTRYFQAMK